MKRREVSFPASRLKFELEPDSYRPCCCGALDCRQGDEIMINSSRMTLPDFAIIIKNKDKPAPGSWVKVFVEWSDEDDD